MKCFSFLLMVAVGLAAIPARLRAASYYVDYSGGSDSNAGTSAAAAFKHCPGDYFATGNAASATLSAGSTVYFKGGVTYTSVYQDSSHGGIVLNWNGSSGSPITYDGNSSGSWGTGKAIIDGGHVVNTWGFGSAGSSYVTIKYFVIQNMGGSATLPGGTPPLASAPGYGVLFGGAASNIIIDHCDFSALGYWFNQSPMGANSIDGNGVQSIAGCTNLSVTNCTFTKMSACVEIMASSTNALNGLTVSGCEFSHYIRWCVDMDSTTTGANFTGVSIHNNKFHDYTEFDQGNWSGSGEWPHTDGIFFRTDFSGCTWSNNNIYDNIWYDSPTAGGDGGTAAIYITEGPTCNIYNNLFEYMLEGDGAIYLYNSGSSPVSSQTVNIYNNTFLTDYVNCLNLSGASGYLNNTTVNVKNNIFYDTQTGSGNNWCVYLNSTDSLTGFTFDYNIYKSSNTSGAFFDWVGGLGSAVLSGLQAHNWENHGKATDPLFTTLSLTDATACNLTLQATSPAIDAGVSESGLFTTDYAGTTRPQGAAWDIGAYEYVSGGGGGSAPAITSSLTASGTVGTAFTYTITGSNSPTAYSASPLPAGLSVNTSTGIISGTPSAAGTTNVTIGATNGSGAGTATLAITVKPAVPAITSALAASGPVGTAFTYTITASNSPTAFSASPLPAGLSVNTSTGVISGTPTAVGSTNVTIGATNATGTGTATLVVTVNPIPPSDATTAISTQ